ncbi:hypothetical protein LTR36_008987 [Oleoguttula mirabilis]|uniref:N-acetylgalactosaminide beta-1,3-galactosyltransferase n=1 Tax=Oleoguttula mirabilis TaxID=1507867 RepID=A0AAV9J6Y1_9PEZI|nr:hypothetical protein LTR36_008987 [Oleoguttula mirabilis]
MPSIFRSGIRAVVVIAVVAALVLAIRLTSFSQTPRWRPPATHPGLTAEVVGAPDPDQPPCRHLAGVEDVVVVMRTGATEIKDKLPIHLNTTFRCYPDTLIFSDYAEVFSGYQVLDALASVDDNLKQSNADFQHYLRLQRLGREGLAEEELHGESYESGPIGKNDNPGWRLDKWKFLPMLVQTLDLRPDKKWFVFVEPDTYIVWSNLVQWLQELDSSKDSYYGSEVQIGDDVFAHGGTGFVMSRSAVQKGAELYTSEPDEWHARTAAHWAGDCILGTALAHAGVGLSWSWPMFQGGNPSDMNWMEIKAGHRLWCAPAMSYHHFSSREIESMWMFEQEQIRQRNVGAEKQFFWHHRDDILHHDDMFRQYVLPNITSERADWSNSSPDLVAYSNRKGLSIADCRAICEEKEGCLQYALGPIGCSTANQVMMGAFSKGIQSGWMTERVESWMKGVKNCKGRKGWSVT